MLIPVPVFLIFSICAHASRALRKVVAFPLPLVVRSALVPSSSQHMLWSLQSDTPENTKLTWYVKRMPARDSSDATFASQLNTVFALPSSRQCTVTQECQETDRGRHEHATFLHRARGLTCLFF